MNPLLILIGNGPERSFSMDRYAAMLTRFAKRYGADVVVLRPTSVVSRGAGHRTFSGKWLGYVDKYLWFPVVARRRMRQLRAQGAELVHICDHSNAPYLSLTRKLRGVVTCHDIFAIRAAQGLVPQRRPAFTGRWQQAWIRRYLQRAPAILCVSRFTRNQLVDLFYPSISELHVIHSAVEDTFRPMAADRAQTLLERAGLNIRTGFVLHVGNRSWYKNREGVLRAFAHMLQNLNAGSGYRLPQLVIAGAPPTADDRRLVETLELGGRVAWAGGLDPETLIAAYSMARAFFFPSIEEGFGWPPLEAMACGCPVVATSGGGLQETLGNSALVADWQDHKALARHLIDLWMKDDVYHTWRDRGLQRVCAFRDAAVAPRYRDYWRAQGLEI